MRTEHTRQKRAAKLHNILGTMGYPLTPSQCLEVASDIDILKTSKAPASAISDSRRVAEQYLDTVLQGLKEKSYEKVTQHTEEKFLVRYKRRDFKKALLNTYEDQGAYMHRKYLTTLKGDTHPDAVDKYPDHKRYVWRGFFEKGEELMILGLYFKNGVYYTSDIGW